MKKDSRTYSDRREYLISAVKKRRKDIRLKSIEYKGGTCHKIALSWQECHICGYSKCNEALEFHHIDSREKDFGISMKGYTRSWSKVKRELDKCLLVCANCHREFHSEFAAFPSNRD